MYVSAEGLDVILLFLTVESDRVKLIDLTPCTIALIACEEMVKF
jgi:hypothetical protein